MMVMRLTPEKNEPQMQEMGNLASISQIHNQMNVLMKRIPGYNLNIRKKLLLLLFCYFLIFLCMPFFPQAL